MGLMSEDQSKHLLKKYGIKIPKFITALTPMEACERSLDLTFPVSFQVVTLGTNCLPNRPVRYANNLKDLQAATALSLSRVNSQHLLERIIVQEKQDVEENLYVSFSIDYLSQEFVIQAACMKNIIDGKKTGHEIVNERISPVSGMNDSFAQRIWSKAGLSRSELAKVCALTLYLFDLFKNFDAYYMEINPLVITSQGTLIAEHSTIAIDDNSMFRHPEFEGIVEVGIERFGRPLTTLEKQVLDLDRADHNRGTIHYVELVGGDIGFMCGSGGGSYMLFDSLLEFGGRPANYSEFRGNPTDQKIIGLTKTILSKNGVRGLFIAQNITSNTQTDIVARAVVAYLQSLKLDFSKFPVIVRQAGVNDKKAFEIFQKAGIECYGDEITLVEASRRMVERMKEAYPGYVEEGYLKWQY